MKKIKRNDMLYNSPSVLNEMISFLGNSITRFSLFISPLSMKMVSVRNVRKVLPLVVLTCGIVINDTYATPVTLSAVCLPEGNKLEWVVVSEGKRLDYEVERKSASDTTFQIIDVVSGSEKELIASYRYFDNNISGAASYRLKWVDESGNVTYSEEVYLERQVITLPISLCQVNDAVTVKGAVQPEIKLYTTSGKPVNAQVIVCQNQFCQVNVTHIPAGVYLIKVQSGKRKYMQQIKIKK
jgi:hypothetical protein